MNTLDSQTGADPRQAYEPPVIVVLGTVEQITLSARSGSYSDFKGRATKKPPTVV